MASFDRIKEGQILHDYHRYKMGNTTMSKEGHWMVRVVAIIPERRIAMCSWNGNPPQRYTEKMIRRLHVSEKKPKAAPAP